LYLIVLYGVCGGLVATAGAGSLLPLFVPGAGSNAVAVVLAPLVQVALVAVLLRRRWAAQTRALQPQAAA
jgi:ABC-type proline/glycine betaine transport system permease subunit